MGRAVALDQDKVEQEEMDGLAGLLQEETVVMVEKKEKGYNLFLTLKDTMDTMDCLALVYHQVPQA
jgi:hypothetical protein